MISLTGESLTIATIGAVAAGAAVRISDSASLRARIAASTHRFTAARQRGESIYGVTTLCGGMADRAVPHDQAAARQRVALLTDRRATGPRLSRDEVRAAMLLRVNPLLHGYSAVRPEVVARYVACLNAGPTPHVHRPSSIGASGDLIPLSCIAGSVLGLDPAFRVKPDGEGLCCRVARDRIGLEPVLRRPLEGLARNNRTGACIAVAALAALRLRTLLVVGFRVQALMLQALQATARSFRPRLHSVKPHPGQVFVAGLFRPLPEGSALVRHEGGGARG